VDLGFWTFLGPCVVPPKIHSGSKSRILIEAKYGRNEEYRIGRTFGGRRRKMDKNKKREENRKLKEEKKINETTKKQIGKINEEKKIR
jgi:hypothetical protein